MEEFSQKQLLTHYLLGLCTSREQEEVETWLGEDDQNIHLLLQVAKEVGGSHPGLSSGDRGQIKEAIFLNIASHSTDRKDPSLSKGKYAENKNHSRTDKKIFFKRAGFWAKAAAVILIMVLASSGAYYYIQQNQEKTTIVWERRTLPYGQTATLRFSDGSIIKLNGGSSLRYPTTFANDKREVYLEGEAFFSIAHDESNPFIVHAGNITTHVLGTSFNIEAYKKEEGVQVVVAEGRVAVTKSDIESSFRSKSKQIILKENQWVTYHTSSGVIERGQGDISDMIAWKDDVLVFHSTPFSEVARMLERWYGVEIILKGDQLGNMILEGKYDDVSLETVLESIQFVLDIEYTMESDVVWIQLSMNKKQKVDKKE